MVDVGDKPPMKREAVAEGFLVASPATLDRLMKGDLPKGEALGVARIAGIQAAKQTPQWIPLCHILALDFVGVEFSRSGPEVLTVHCTARATGRTGVEMEAMTGAAAASLAIYDMVKGMDKGVEIGPIRLERKSGGKSGDYVRS